MSTTQKVSTSFIESKRHSIAQDRQKARYLRVGSWVLWIAGIALLFTGLIVGVDLAPANVFNDPFSQMLPRVTTHLSSLLYERIPLVWAILRAIVPYPRFDTTNVAAHWSSWGGWLVWGYGLIFLALRFDQRASYLKQKSYKTEEALDNYLPVLLHVQASRIAVSGDSNVINAVNTINNISGPNKESWWVMPVSSIVLGVVANWISKYLLA